MINAIKEIYQKTPVILKAAPFLCAVPVLAEGAQHIAEFQLGMFAEGDGISAGFEMRVRMVFGIVKVLSILFAFIWIPRFWYNGGSLMAALIFRGRELRFLVWSAVLMLAVVLFVFFLGPILTKAIINIGINLPQAIRPYFPLILLMIVLGATQNLSLWWMGGVLGDRSMTKARSRTCLKGQLNWMTGVLILSVGPAMALHYFLNFRSMGAGFFTQIALLALDSVLVGFMAVLLGNSMWVTYKRLAKNS